MSINLEDIFIYIYIYIYIYVCVCVCVCVCVSSAAQANDLEAMTSPMGTPSGQTVLSKYHFPRKGTRPAWENG